MRPNSRIHRPIRFQPAFFTRALRAGTQTRGRGRGGLTGRRQDQPDRPIRGGRLLQAKGHEFELLALLAGDKEKDRRVSRWPVRDRLPVAQRLPPRAPAVCGTLDSMVFVPGELFSVSDATTHWYPGCLRATNA